jgi:site-specific DNA-methyltransferase (adenine-specific)
VSTADPVRRRVRSGTTTSQFGASRRENHDASGFYRRFTPPTISDDEDVCHPVERCGLDRVFLGDIRDQPSTVAPRSVALVVTSPPYYSGKEYETAIGEGNVLASDTEYLAMLTGVLGACVDALEPGGRIRAPTAGAGIPGSRLPGPPGSPSSGIAG